MDSFTSHSEPAVPWRAVKLLALALAAWAVGAAYTVTIRPDVEFYVHGHKVKMTWAARLNSRRQPKFVLVGGSSCASQLHARWMMATNGLAALNLGQGAAMGAKVLTRYSLPHVQPGDTLVLALEQGLLGEDLAVPAPGVQFSLAIGQPALLRENGQDSWLPWLMQLRPGAYHAFTLLGKVALRQPLFRYSNDEWQEDGSLDVAARMEFPPFAPNRLSLSSEGRRWLIKVRNWCEEHGARVVLTLPWCYPNLADSKISDA